VSDTSTPLDNRVTRALVALAIAKRTELDDLTLQVYLGGLADLPVAQVARACERLSRLPRAPFEPALPTLGTVIQTAVEIGREDRAAADKAKLLPAPASADDDPRTWVCCRDCEDTGWRSFRCTGAHATVPAADQRDSELTPQWCGRSRQHQGHAWTAPCPCVETNPVIARRRDAARHSAA